VVVTWVVQMPYSIAFVSVVLTESVL